MFRVDPNPTFTSDVPVVIGDSRQELRTTYRALPDAQIEGYDLTAVPGIRAFLSAAIVRFEDVADAEGAPLSEDAAREVLFGQQYVRVALVQGYFLGVTSGRAGN